MFSTSQTESDKIYAYLDYLYSIGLYDRDAANSMSTGVAFAKGGHFACDHYEYCAAVHRYLIINDIEAF